MNYASTEFDILISYKVKNMTSNCCHLIQLHGKIVNAFIFKYSLKPFDLNWKNNPSDSYISDVTPSSEVLVQAVSSTRLYCNVSNLDTGSTATVWWIRNSDKEEFDVLIFIFCIRGFFIGCIVHNKNPLYPFV